MSGSLSESSQNAEIAKEAYLNLSFLSLKLLLQVATHIFLKAKQKLHKIDHKSLVIRLKLME